MLRSPQRWTHPKIQQGIALILEGLADPAGEAERLASAEYDALLADVAELRGRPLVFPYLSCGRGQGARIRLADGRSVLDLVLGIGVHFFGHSDPDLLRTAIEAALEDTAMQGHLQMGTSVPRLLSTLLANAGGRLRHGWIANSGTEANETALKIIRQRQAPAAEIVAFRGCFHGRTSVMAEITDRPDYREGQPRRETVHYLPYFDGREPQRAPAAHTQLRDLFRARRDQIACMVFELVQGESGFRTAPREFFEPLMRECRTAGVAVWVDEIQTFGRTGELFAFQKLGLASYVDVVTVGKMLHCAATLYTDEYNPRPGLVAGTFAGTTVGLAIGRRIVERLLAEGFLGPYGRIARGGAFAEDRLRRLARDIGDRRVCAIDGVGAMWSVELAAASHGAVLTLLRRCFDAGLLLYYGGTGPYRLRLFLPATISEPEIDEAVDILESCLRQDL
jgi:4-aminobutyrate aminotransferase / (S)-3-amino-2-methylpropionate transaminase / 5-aminovalerate transaminase